MRILHVLPGLAAGGMEQLAITLAADAAVHGDTVVVASGPGVWVERVAQAGAVHVALPATSRHAAPGMATATWAGSRRLRHSLPRPPPGQPAGDRMRAVSRPVAGESRLSG